MNSIYLALLTNKKSKDEDGPISILISKRNRTSSLEYIGYSLYLYFLLGLSIRNVVKALSYMHIVKRGHVAVWKWIQKYKPKKISSKRK